MKRTTTITVLGERWDVPRGFGAAYSREVRHQLDLIATCKPGVIIGELIDLMLMIGYAPTVAAVATWDLRKRVEAAIYSTTTMLRASDNAVQRHPELPWLPKPWQGPPAERPPHIRPDLWGAFQGPTATEIAS